MGDAFFSASWIIDTVWKRNCIIASSICKTPSCPTNLNNTNMIERDIISFQWSTILKTKSWTSNKEVVLIAYIFFMLVFIMILSFSKTNGVQTMYNSCLWWIYVLIKPQTFFFISLFATRIDLAYIVVISFISCENSQKCVFSMFSCSSNKIYTTSLSFF